MPSLSIHLEQEVRLDEVDLTKSIIFCLFSTQSAINADRDSIYAQLT